MSAEQDLQTLRDFHVELAALISKVGSAREAAERLESAGYGGAELVLDWLDETMRNGDDSLGSGADYFRLLEAAKGDGFAVDWLINVPDTSTDS